MPRVASRSVSVLVQVATAVALLACLSSMVQQTDAARVRHTLRNSMRAQHTDVAEQVAQEQAEEKLEQAAIVNAHASLAALVKHVAQRIALPAATVAPSGRTAPIGLGSGASSPQNETADHAAHAEAPASSTAGASTEAAQEDDEDDEDEDEVTNLIQIKG